MSSELLIKLIEFNVVSPVCLNSFVLTFFELQLQSVIFTKQLYKILVCGGGIAFISK